MVRCLYSGSLFVRSVAGWSSPVARWAHNPKVGGSNPPPATKFHGPNLKEFGPFSCVRTTFKNTPENDVSRHCPTETAGSTAGSTRSTRGVSATSRPRSLGRSATRKDRLGFSGEESRHLARLSTTEIPHLSGAVDSRTGMVDRGEPMLFLDCLERSLRLSRLCFLDVRLSNPSVEFFSPPFPPTPRP